MRKHQKEFWIASWILGLIAVSFVLFQTVPSFRIAVFDMYSAIFKQIISDRVLKEESSVTSNVFYCSSRSPQQTLDLYTPPHTSGARLPLVVFIHGGGWKIGDKANHETTYYGEPLLRNGISIASINYRLSPDYTYPTQNNDVACALSYLRKNAERHHIATDRWGIFGDSAGAQLGALATVNPEINAPIRAFVGLYGPYDLQAQIDRQPRTDHDAWVYTNKAQSVELASPYYHRANTNVRYLLFHGTKDRVVSSIQSQNYARKLQNDGANVTYVAVQNAGHYFSPRTIPSSQKIRDQVTQFYVSALK